MKMNLKKKFYETEKTSRKIYYVYGGFSLVFLITAHLVYFVSKNSENARLLTETAVLIFAMGVWGGLFFEILYKKIKK